VKYWIILCLIVAFLLGFGIGFITNGFVINNYVEKRYESIKDAFGFTLQAMYDGDNGDTYSEYARYFYRINDFNSTIDYCKQAQEFYASSITNWLTVQKIVNETPKDEFFLSLYDLAIAGEKLSRLGEMACIKLSEASESYSYGYYDEGDAKIEELNNLINETRMWVDKYNNAYSKLLAG